MPPEAPLPRRPRNRLSVRVVGGRRDGDLDVGCRISPGYGRWPLSAQKALFARLPHETLGVSLNPSMMMTPRKSISFALWLGAKSGAEVRALRMRHVRPAALSLPPLRRGQEITFFPRGDELMAPQVRPTVSLLSSDDVETIVQEACDVLSETGVLVENHDGRLLLRDGGATEASGRFRIPEAMARRCAGDGSAAHRAFRPGRRSRDGPGRRPSPLRSRLGGHPPLRRLHAAAPGDLDPRRRPVRPPRRRPAELRRPVDGADAGRRPGRDGGPVPPLPDSPLCPQAGGHRHLPEGRLRPDARAAPRRARERRPS